MKKIVQYATVVAFSLTAGLTALAQDHVSVKSAAPQIEGRWDMTVIENGVPKPSWLEIVHSGHKRLVGHFVGMGGSARPISQVFFKDGKMSFTIPPQWEAEDNDQKFEATLEGDKLVGTMVEANGKVWPFTAVKAPALRPTKAPVWGKPIQLFNGKNLDGWVPLGENNQWVVENGVLKSPRSGVNIATKQKFKDFKLKLEFRCPPGSNSGVYLRGRYEVQIQDSYGMEPAKDLLGAVYGFIAPVEMAAKPAGEWQTYEITLVGRYITVFLNGKQIIYYQEIPGITGGALDSNEGEPGPIYFQGDHGPIEFRNITITPAL
ncbi:MAG TPA: DUF1080 domain-containing protein [Flavihumibacter sp.]|jgi:hypothetical protein